MTKDSFKQLLSFLQFEQQGNIFTKHFAESEANLTVDFGKEILIYPEDKGFTVHDKTTSNFSASENYVVFECVHRLLEKGYKPKHIELEPKWKLGHGASGGRADILVYDQEKKPLLIIECKTAGKEFDKAWKETQNDGDQLFSYAQQIPQTEFLCLYASDFDEKEKYLSTYQRIVSHKDNPKIIEQADKKLKTFQEARDLKERFGVWRDSYQLEYTEKGIFEENIQPYQIGKDKYTLEIDTRPIDATDKKGKYHQFRTILRKHNIARKETAFEVLVNLFLCKIVDEKEHQDNLHFYWKGIAYDNYFDFVDRLQKLYQIGMKRFLKEDITYISNDEIDSAFWTVKNKRNATKKTIQEYFRKLKFFTNNAFSFRDVHNETIFIKNSKILLEIVQMWQNLRLQTKDQNQFLGDMFEYFLDNSIKQSEGQFFTPVPICKFIVSSLPLETALKNKAEPLKAIDYACGSGHFLNEYALQIKPLVEKHKKLDKSAYFGEIYGIEKEDRLAKIAKISAFMYGQDEINIIDSDALDEHAEIKPETFDVLVANPPFAVEGFLETLPEEQREKYELIKTVNDLNNSNIQCFFIERAKQLLAPNAVAGFIVPSSVLSNSDKTHVASREILLKYFDIVSIAELGGGTFGKTGTNTVVLFIRRKSLKPEPAEHYKNRVDDFFEGIKEGDRQLQEYQDLYLIRAYCEQIEISFDEYLKLINATPEKIGELDTLFEHELFKDYKADFERSTIIINLKKSKPFKDLSPKEQQQLINKRLIAYLHRIEKDKLYYFILAYNNPCKVLIVKSPSDTKELKQFLGYEWKGAKGQEGIKYTGGEIISDIITPMFDPKNAHNADKINYYIQQNFDGNQIDVPNKYISDHKLIDLLDFSRKDFSKTFSLTAKSKFTVESKWNLVNLSDVALINPSKTELSEIDDNTMVSFIEMASVSNDGFITQKVDKPLKELKKGSFTYFRENDIIIAKITPCMENGKCAVAENLTNGLALGSSEFHVFRTNEKVINKYIFEFLNREEIRREAEQNMTGSTGHRRVPSSFYEKLKIPLPPLEVQTNIVEECVSVDAEVTQANTIIEQAKAAIAEKVLNIDFAKQKLSEIVKKVNEQIDPQSKDGEVFYIGLENIGSNTGNLVGETLTDYSEIKSAKTCFKNNDILYGKLRPNLNKVYLAEQEGICSTDILVLRLENKDLARFYSHYFLTKQFNDEVLKGVSGQQLPRTSWGHLSTIKIPVPDLDTQEKLVAEITKLEAEIIEARKIIESSAERKQAVMRKYL